MIDAANNYFASQLGVAPLAIEYFKDWGLNSTIAQLVFSNGKPSKLQINSCRVKESQILALCHEYIHYWQFLRGDLKIKGNKEFWRGNDCSAMDYASRPHEIEARQLQFSWYVAFNQNKPLTSSPK